MEVNFIMVRNSKTMSVVVAGLLCAIGIVVPMFMPRVTLGPMSFTLASHVAIFIAMFISPGTAVAVSIGTTIGFFMTAPPIIALRAASHIVFAYLGAIYLVKKPETLKKPLPLLAWGAILALIHGVSEVLIVTPVFLGGSMFSEAQLANGFFMSVVVLVGVGTVIHSMIDLGISLIIWKPLEKSFKRA